MINVLVWNEFRHEKEMENVRALYPDGIHEYIANFLRSDEINVKTAYLDMPECGLTDDVLKNTDVLIWWAHCYHDEVPDEVAKRVQEYVLKGMGLIVLHSGHLCKPFKSFLWARPARLDGEMITKSVFGAQSRATRLQREYPSILSLTLRKCTANFSIFPTPMTRCS